MGRAIRRYHNARLKRKRLRYWGGDVLTPRQLGKCFKTPASRNHHQWQNKRKHFGITRQELKSILNFKEQLIKGAK